LVRGALLADLAATVLSMPVSIFPLVNAERFGNDPRTLGLFLTAIAVGGVFASAFSGAFTRLPRSGLVMLGGSAAWGAALALFALSPDPWLGLALLALAGAADTVSVVTRSTIVQLHTPDALLGRVAAAEQIVGQAGPDIGNLRGGLIAGATSGTAALVSGGLLCMAAVALISATTPRLRRYSTTTASKDRYVTLDRPSGVPHHATVDPVRVPLDHRLVQLEGAGRSLYRRVEVLEVPAGTVDVVRAVVGAVVVSGDHGGGAQ
jgi:MFS family permease